jgi:hypothetical protein
LVRKGNGVYARPLDAPLSWAGVVYTLQTLLDLPLHPGGPTALDEAGYQHDLNPGRRSVYLYTDSYARVPGWLGKLEGGPRFVVVRTTFLKAPASTVPREIRSGAGASMRLGWKRLEFESFSLTLSSPERAFLELLQGVPERFDFERAAHYAESLGTLRAEKMQELLEACGLLKVRRLALYFGAAYGLAWYAKLDRARLPLGMGKRALVKDGQWMPDFQISVPRNLPAAGVRRESHG